MLSYPASQYTPKLGSRRFIEYSPREKTSLAIDMPSRLDHLGTVASYKESIHQMDTAAHSTINMRLRDSQDSLIPMERTTYERTVKAITEEKYKLRKAEEFFDIHRERFGHVFAASGLRQQHPPGTPSVSFDRALINVNSSRLSKNYVSFRHCQLDSLRC